MKKIIILFLIFTLKGFSQNYKEVKISELTHKVSIDSTSMMVFLKDEPLNGNYKIINDKFPTRFSMTNFIQGKAEGESKYYIDGNLTGIKELKNGIPNGYSIVYDNTGKTMMWKIPKVNGKSHGIAWFGDEGEIYYWKGKKVTKEEYEKRLREN